MSLTLQQIFALNPSTTIANTDLFYLVKSPYSPGTDSGISGLNLKASFLQPTNNLSDLTNVATARTNLGLTTLATATPPLSGTLGGTGVNNGANTATYAGSLNFASSFTTAGAFAVTQTYTGITNVTFPTTGTLATTAQLPTPAALTKVDDTNVTLTLGGTPATALLQAVSLTLGWIGQLSGARGGTGVNNGANTATFAGNLNFASSFTTVGAFAVTHTYTGATNVTFPTTGTLLTAATINAYEADGRLTLTTNTPVTNTDVTAATTLFYTPYIGDHLALFDGASTWTTLTFTQLSIAVPATTNQMYDVFVFNNSGTATLELTAWTNDTTRATALAYQNGILVKSGTTTRRYLGSFRTTGVSGQTEDSLIKRYVWNYYNRVVRNMKVIDTTDTWNYSLTAYRQANANAANQLDCVQGVSEDSVTVFVYGKAASSAATGRNVGVGVGINSTTVNSAQIFTNGSISSSQASPVIAYFNAYIPVGRVTLVWLESGAGADTQSWMGDQGLPNTQCGIMGSILG